MTASFPLVNSLPALPRNNKHLGSYGHKISQMESCWQFKFMTKRKGPAGSRTWRRDSVYRSGKTAAFDAVSWTVSRYGQRVN